MDSLQFAILVIIHQVSLARGAVTITFDDNGYIGQSIVLQCKTNDTFLSKNGVWFFNDNLIISTTTGRYSEIKTPDGFNLTISDLTTDHAGYYSCAIDFGSSSNKTLGMLYNTSIEITDNPSTLKVTITIIAYPAPEYSVTLTKNGSLVTVPWTSTNITRPDGALEITLISPALNKTDYELTVNVARPVAAFKHYYVNFAPTPNKPPQCNLELGLGLGLGLGIPIVVTIIVVVIFIYTDYKYAYYLGLVHGVGIGITFQVGWIIIASLISTGTTSCKLELGLGLGLGSGIPCLITSIIALIFKFFSLPLFKGIPSRVEIGTGIITGLLIAIVIGIYVYLKYDKPKQKRTCIKHKDNPPKPDDDKPKPKNGQNPEHVPLDQTDKKGKTNNSGSSSAVSREQVQVQMENKGVKDDDEERPPAVHTGTQNKVDPNTSSKQINDRQQPVPPANTEFEDTPTFRPLPPPPQNGEIKDRNLRGISATIGGTPDLASETPRPNRLLPLTPKQATVQKEDASDEPKRKRKKKKKKDQMNVETPEEENGETDMRVN